MSLKNIDMQLAVQRTENASRLQHTMNREAQLMNMAAAHTVQKQEEKKTKTVLRREEAGKLALRNDKRERTLYKHRRGSKQKNADGEEMLHPYKGKFIDTNG